MYSHTVCSMGKCYKVLNNNPDSNTTVNEWTIYVCIRGCPFCYQRCFRTNNVGFSLFVSPSAHPPTLPPTETNKTMAMIQMWPVWTCTVSETGEDRCPEFRLRSFSMSIAGDRYQIGSYLAWSAYAVGHTSILFSEWTGCSPTHILTKLACSKTISTKPDGLLSLWNVKEDVCICDAGFWIDIDVILLVPVFAEDTWLCEVLLPEGLANLLS